MPPPKPAKAPKPTKAPKPPKPAKERSLTKELGQLLAKTILPDLRERAKDEAVYAELKRQFEAERKDKRTGDTFDAWSARTLEQVGVAWILSCVFLRTLEDRGLLSHARLAGPGATDAEHLFFELFPSLGIRDYLLAVFRELSHLPGGGRGARPQAQPGLAPRAERRGAAGAGRVLPRNGCSREHAGRAGLDVPPG